jgi:hypothetical protein
MLSSEIETATTILTMLIQLQAKKVYFRLSERHKSVFV